MTLKVGTKHRVLECYQVCSNDDPELTFTYFTARSNLVPYAFIWEKGNTMDFSETVVVFVISEFHLISMLVDAVNKMSKWICMKIKGQGHSLTLVQGHSDSTFSNFISLETARLIESKCHVNPPSDGGKKICSNGPGHMIKMAAMSIYGKNIKKSSPDLWNQKADDLEIDMQH